MARWAWNKSPAQVKRRYFELIRQGSSGSAAALEVGVSLSCGSVWFVDSGGVKFIDTPISALRALNYPEQLVPPKPGQLRAGAHTDYGSLTILLPQEGSKGLELMTPDGQWTPVPPVPGAFVINIGDLMARWTNDRWVSTLHRVVNPSPEDGGMARRQSLAFFHQPNWDAEITVLDACLNEGEAAKYAPVLSGPYLMSKFKSTSA